MSATPQGRRFDSAVAEANKKNLVLLTISYTGFNSPVVINSFQNIAEQIVCNVIIKMYLKLQNFMQ